MGKFTITKRSNGDFQFNLKATNGQTILSGEGYKTKDGCKNGIDSVKSNSKSYERYENKTSINGKYYFNLTATNGQIIGTSEMYETTTGRDNGLDSVKSNAPQAVVEDFS